MEVDMTLLEELERDEGFREKPYKCSEDVWTFGHGFTFLSVEESRVVLNMKIDKLRDTLNPSIKNLTPARQDVIVNMAYNLGIVGLFSFKLMWNAIYQKDWERASKEMLNSKWSRQVGGRAKRLAEEMRKGKHDHS
jgi:lysozyme